jgi:hypothetical protein
MQQVPAVIPHAGSTFRHEEAEGVNRQDTAILTSMVHADEQQ